MKLVKARSFLLTACAVGFFSFSQSYLSGQETIFLSPAEELTIQAAREKQVPEEIQTNGFLSVFRSYDDEQYLHKIHPNAYYYPVAVTTSGDNVQLQDGSLWFVNPHHRKYVLNWVSSDPIFIKPNASCFSMYSYVLQNRQNQDIVEVSLVSPAIDTSVYARWIVQIDPARRRVTLNDGTLWYVNPGDSTFNKWQIGHRVLFGVNNKWRSSDYPHILIDTGIYKAPYCEVDVTY